MVILRAEVVGSGDGARKDAHAPAYRGATLGHLVFLRVAGREELKVGSARISR